MCRVCMPTSLCAGVVRIGEGINEIHSVRINERARACVRACASVHVRERACADQAVVDEEDARVGVDVGPGVLGLTVLRKNPRRHLCVCVRVCVRARMPCVCVHSCVRCVM